MKFFSLPTPKGIRQIGGEAPCFVVAEMSGNHNQNFAQGVAIIEAAAAAGADAVKIQTYTPDTITIDSRKEWFVVRGKDQPEIWQQKTLYDLYKTAYTPWEWQAELKKRTEALGLVFFSTPFDDTAVDFLEKLEVPCYKIASYECTDYTLLRRVAQTGKPVIISVGFATLEEVSFALETLRQHGAKDIAVLHCVTEYEGAPNLDAMNLRTMLDIRDRYEVVVGFSDNNAGIEVPLTAAAMGAAIIEKHVTIERAAGGPDGRFSLEPNELKAMVEGIRRVERVRGRVHYGCQSEKEKENTFFRRSLFVVKDMKRGEIFTAENVRSIRPSNGMETRYYDDVIGKRATQDIERGTPLAWELII